MSLTPERCVACGQSVRIYTSGEGTSSYEPACEEELAALRSTLATVEERYEKANSDAIANGKDAAVYAQRLSDAEQALATVEGERDEAREQNRAKMLVINSYEETRAKLWAERDQLRAERDALVEAGDRLATVADELPQQTVWTNETDLLAEPWFSKRNRAVRRWREATSSGAGLALEACPAPDSIAGVPVEKLYGPAHKMTDEDA